MLEFWILAGFVQVTIAALNSWWGGGLSCLWDSIPQHFFPSFGSSILATSSLTMFPEPWWKEGRAGKDAPFRAEHSVSALWPRMRLCIDGCTVQSFPLTRSVLGFKFQTLCLCLHPPPLSHQHSQWSHFGLVPLSPPTPKSSALVSQLSQGLGIFFSNFPPLWSSSSPQGNPNCTR